VPFTADKLKFEEQLEMVASAVSDGASENSIEIQQSSLCVTVQLASAQEKAQWLEMVRGRGFACVRACRATSVRAPLHRQVAHCVA
jgi:hypothetical protein